MQVTQWLIREWTNAVSLALFGCLTYRFARVALTTDKRHPRRNAAIALCALCLGETIRSLWAWTALASQNKQWAIFPIVREMWWAALLASALIIAGALCCIRVFSSENERHEQYGALILAALFLAFTMVI